MQISRETQLAYGGAAIAAANNTDGNSTRFDMANWEGVRFFTTITDSVSGGVATLKIEQNTADSDSGMAAIAGASAAATSGANDDLNGKVLVVDVYRPRERYVQAVRVSATQNIAFGEVYAEFYGPRVKPPADHSTVSAAATVSSPAEA